jgi:hypothetical protein
MTNKRVFATILLSLICLILNINPSFSQQSASQLFEKALYIEEAKGELQAAIEPYQQILNRYPEDLISDRWRIFCHNMKLTDTR